MPDAARLWMIRPQPMGTSRNSEPIGASTGSASLLARARAGDSRALSTLFRRQGDQLLRWARGKLPRWARRLHDTADLVQETLLNTFRHLHRFENRGTGALQAYLRQAVTNRIRDEVRNVGRRPVTDLEDRIGDFAATGPLPDQLTFDAEQERRYKAALAQLTTAEQLLIVGRIELGYNYHQLALITSRATAGAARVALSRAIVKLVEKMSAV